MTRSLLIILFSWSLVVGSVRAAEATIEHDGLTLNANLELVDDSGLADGVVVILHGTLGHNEMEIISTLQSVFAENERNSLAINLSLNVDDRHGFFPCENQHTHRIGDASKELAAWLAWLASKGADDIVLLGHSRGGNQVTRFVVDNAPDVTAAILIAPSTEGESVVTDGGVALSQAETDKWLRDVPFLHCAEATVSADSYRSYYGPLNRMNTPAMLGDVEVPVLVFAGTEDDVVPDLAKHMTMVNNNNVVFEEIEGAGHFFRDLYTYDVVDRALEFLGALE